MGTRRTEDRERQVEERLAALLRPGPRRARLPPEEGSEADDTLIGDRTPRDMAEDSDPAISQAQTGWLDEELDGEELESDADEQLDLGEVEVFGDPSPVPGRIARVVGWLWRLLPIGSLAGFGRQQLAVIGVIVALGALFGGWAVLRARPIAIGAPRLTATTGSASSHAGQTSPSPGTASRASSSPSPSTAPSPTPGAVEATSANPTAGETIQVHVLGAVHKPGVVTLPLGARVQDAIRRAGGTKQSARLGDLNLAQPLSDGQQVFVGHGGRDSEVRDPVSDPPPDSAGPGASGPVQQSGAGQQSGRTQSDPIDLNTATLDQLDTLPGIGPVTAQKILDWRTEHGKFSSIDELQEVAGIGPKTFADLKSAVRV